MAEYADRRAHRLHLRSTVEHVNHDELTRWCLEQGWSGMGWGLWDGESDREWEDYLVRATGNLGNVRRFHALEQGTLLWTRERSGVYWLGELTGPWQYRGDELAERLDLFNVRRTRWWEVGTEEKVPGRVVNAFRSPMTLQEVEERGARRYSNRRHALLTGAAEKLESEDPQAVLSSLLGAEDLEDLVAVYLQDRYGYLLVSRNRSTPGYEYDFRHREDGRRAVCSVKSGHTHVDLELLPSDSVDASFAYAVSGGYDGLAHTNLTCIRTEDLASFLLERRAVLPERVALWLDRS